MPACSQTFTFGAKAGIPLTALLSASSPAYRAETWPFTFGPTIEASLPYRLSFEAGLLYKRLQYGFSKTTAASRWELPLLLKYRLSAKQFRPFFDAGVSFNRVTGDAKSQDVELRHRGARGLTAGGGVEVRAGALHISPELRFTRWADRSFGVSDAPLLSNLSQVELLIGLAF